MCFGKTESCYITAHSCYTKPVSCAILTMVRRMRDISEFHDITNFKAVRSLQINSCGLQRVGQYSYTVLRSRGRVDYHLLYVQSGWLTAYLDEKQVRLIPGSCVFYPPDVRQQYDLTSEGESVSYWLHFTGTAIEEALADFSHDCAAYTEITDCVQFESIFHQLCSVHNMQGTAYQLDENALLLQLLAILTRSASHEKHADRSAVRTVAAYISEHYCEQISLAECAAQLHLSISRFSHLFTQTIGVSPYQYLLKHRIAKAQELLLYSQLDVKGIARTVGFQDASYFCRVFRRHVGVNPLYIRKQAMSWTEENRKKK